MFPLGTLDDRSALVVIVAVLFAIYLASGLSQEFLMNYRRLTLSGVVTLVGPLITTIICGITGAFGVERKAPLKSYFLVGFLGLVSMYTATLSLQFVSYPTQIVAKSSKVLSVMFVGKVVYNRNVGAMTVLSGILLVLSISCFVSAEEDHGMEGSGMGMLILCVSLLADAFLGQTQQQLFEDFGPSQHEVNAWSSLISSGGILLGLMVFDGGRELVAVTQLDSLSYLSLAVNGIAVWLGMYPVLALNEYYGATSTAFWTSCRKLLTICLSFVIFPKPFSPLHALGGILAAIGIAVNILGKQPHTTKHTSSTPTPPSPKKYTNSPAVSDSEQDTDTDDRRHNHHLEATPTQIDNV